MRANLDDSPVSFEELNELAKVYARFDDGLDDDFIEEEWQFVRESDDEDDEGDFTPTLAPHWYVDEDEDDEEYENEDEDDDQDWDAGTEEYDDEDDEDEDWYEDEEE